MYKVGVKCFAEGCLKDILETLGFRPSTSQLKHRHTLQPLTHMLHPSCFPSPVCCVFPVQLRNKLNQDQNSKLQQQRDSLNKRNLEVAAMDKRVSELRDRLWKKKAALQHKENLPVR